MSDDEVTRLLRAALDAAISYIFALEGQTEEVAARARQSYNAALDALEEVDPSGAAVRLAGTEEEFEFYRDLANQEPQGPPVRRHRGDEESDDELPAPLRRLRELGRESAEQATPSDDAVRRVLGHVIGEVGGDLLATALAAHYLSTYCMHGLHDDCRRECKTCKRPCRCPCHAGSDADGPRSPTGGSHVVVASDPVGGRDVGTGNPDVPPSDDDLPDASHGMIL